MSYYENAVGRRMYMPEPSLDEPENWRFGFPQPEYESEYDRAEDELNGIYNRS